MKRWWEDLEPAQQKLMVQLSVVVFFLIAAIPFIIWAIILPVAPYWLESLVVWWPVTLCGSAFIAFVVNIIYQNVRNK